MLFTQLFSLFLWNFCKNFQVLTFLSNDVLYSPYIVVLNNCTWWMNEKNAKPIFLQIKLKTKTKKNE